jgi:hypothetical protein
MKKLFVVAMAAMLCVCFALPAAAEVKISGMLWVDFYVRDISPEVNYVNAGGFGGVVTPPFVAGDYPVSDGVKDFQINAPLSQNYLNFSYANSKGTYGAIMTLFAGYTNDWSTWNMMGNQSSIWWKPMANLTLRLGKINQFVGGLYPFTGVGNAEYYRNLDDPIATGAISGAGGMASGPATGQVPAAIAFGNLHTSAKPGIHAEYKINDMFTLNLGIYDPDYDTVDNDNFTLLSTRGAGTTAIQEGVLPRFDISLPITVGNFYIQPKAGWLRKEYDEVAANQDDSFDIWMMGVDASVKFGPVTLAGEYVRGQNLGAGNFTGGLSTQGPRAYTVGGITHISDTEQVMYWGELSWTVTPKVLIRGSYGKIEATDDVNPALTADDWLFERSFMALNLRYAVAPNFFIHPSWSRLIYGDSNKYGLGARTVDGGDLDLYGVSFYIIF